MLLQTPLPLTDSGKFKLKRTLEAFQYGSGEDFEAAEAAAEAASEGRGGEEGAAGLG